MKISISHVTSTLRAGAVLLLNQPSQGQATLGSPALANTETEHHDNLPFDVTEISRTDAGGRTIINELIVPMQPAWDQISKKRFKDLAIKEALEQISPDEQGELEFLSLLRRKEDSSDNPEHIIWEYKQRKLTDELMTLLEKYVEFHHPGENASRRERPKTKG